MSQTLSAMVERLGQADSVIGEAAAFSVERVLLVLNVFWLNLQTLVWPAHLSFSYAPVRPQYILEPQVILGLAAAGLCGATFWAIRRRKSMLLGLVWFGLALIPSAQILPHHIHRADRFLYLPLVGLALALAMGLRQFFGLVKGRNTAGGVAVACGLGLCLLGTLCAAQVQAWRGNLTLWESAVAGAPRSAFAHQCYAKTLAGAGESRRAFSHYEIALRLNPYNPHALKSLAEGLATAQDVNLRDYELAIRLAEWACTLTEWRDRELLHTLALVYNNTAVDLAENGRFDRAVDLYRKAVQSDPRYAAPAFNLSLLLATCPDRDLRQPDEAVRLAEEACQLLGRPDANGLMILAVAYEQAGRTGEAMATTQKAIGRADAAGDIRLAKFLRTRLRLFQNRDIPIQGGP
jgi:tetratricopeptide (TPR) repeat protein